MTPRKNGILIQCGKIRTNLPAANALTAAKSLLADQEEFEQIVSLTVYLNAEDTFEAYSTLADFASEFLYEQLGGKGVGSRAAVGVASLPGNAPVEIQLIAAVAVGS